MNREQGKLFYVDVDTKKRIEINPNLGQFSIAKLSPDKHKIALVSDANELYFINTDELASGTVNPRKSTADIYISPFGGLLDRCFDWSPDSKYFVVAGYDKTEIYDMNDTEYKFIKPTDFPIGIDITKIRWTN